MGRRGAERRSREQGLDVEAGAADDHRARSASFDVDDCGTRTVSESVGVEDLVWVNYVKQVVRRAFSFGERGFGCSDVQAPVDLSGVGGDDFNGRVVRQLQGKAGLAGGGGADDD